MLRTFIALGPRRARLGQFFISRVLFYHVAGRPGLDFNGFWDGLGRVLEALTPHFSTFFRACGLDMRKCSDPYKTLAGAAKIKVFDASQTVCISKKNDAKSLQEPF